MRNRVTFEKLSNFLYDVKIDGRQSILTVEFDAGWFTCRNEQLGMIYARTLAEMRTFIENEID